MDSQPAGADFLGAGKKSGPDAARLCGWSYIEVIQPSVSDGREPGRSAVRQGDEDVALGNHHIPDPAEDLGVRVETRKVGQGGASRREEDLRQGRRVLLGRPPQRAVSHASALRRFRAAVNRS
jgi:hypothetical protein